MAGKYQAYPEYQESNGSWLREIPIHWTILPLKRVCGLSTGLTPPTDDEFHYAEDDSGRPWVRTEDLNEVGGSTRASKFLSQSGWELMRVVPRYSTLICCIGTIGKTGYVTSDVSTNQQITSASFRYSPRFNYYLIQAARKVLEETATGNVIQILNSERLGRIAYLLTPNSEAEKIANFLDHETAKIDTLIEKQQQLIKLLKEKRQAVISHAVTKGLNSNAPMRDSGVEWLGEVPAHWDVTKIKYIAELTPKKSEVEQFKSQSCSFVPMEKLKKDTLILDEVRLVGEVFDGYTYFKNEDILVAKVTPCFENKNMVVARDLENGIGFGSSEIYVLRARLNLLNDFLYYRLQEDVFIDLATAAMSGAGGLKRVPSDFVNNFETALPPENERTQIVDYIRQYTSKFDVLINKAEDAIKLMQERRTALISAAVTGKIDVRDWQAPEPLNNTGNKALAA